LAIRRENTFLNEELMMQLANIDKFEKPVSIEPEGKTSDLLPRALILLGFVSIVFAAAPELDLMTSRSFWDAANGFDAGKNPVLIALRDMNRSLPWILIGTATALLAANYFTSSIKHIAPPHKLLFLITFFAVGPGLSVEAIKAFVGRARPRALEEFGGNAVFTPPWDLTDQCIRNCSFISGEASSAFALLTLVVFVKPRYVKIYLGAVGVPAAAFAFNRVIFGAHFLSDVVIAWNVMWILAVLLWRMFSRNAMQIDAIFSRR
jgi:lipid A 4'-phosphatase